MGVAAGLLDAGRDLLAGVRLAAGDHHFGAEFCEQLRRGAADAAAGAGDDGDLAGEIERGGFHVCLLARHSGARAARTRNPEVVISRFRVRCFASPRNDGIHLLVIPGWSAGPDPESRDSGFALRAPRNEGKQREATMAQGKSLEGKSIIVTGAGRGIGRELALLCAAEGAKVVVNDPGVAADGSGSSASPAEEVVEEIKKRGGTAVANFETVAEAIPASKIVKTAIDSFGKLDGVVNNAGILRDAIFHRMSIDAFEQVIKVHLMGSFYVSHAAARLFKEQESGSFVHFTSTSGLVGNFGQANC